MRYNGRTNLMNFIKYDGSDTDRFRLLCTNEGFISKMLSKMLQNYVNALSQVYNDNSQVAKRINPIKIDNIEISKR